MTQASNPPQIVLASQSPRRRELLAQLGVGFHVESVSIDETPLPNEAAMDYVLRVAEDKARAGWEGAGKRLGLPVLGSDTAVVVDGEILGKPRDAADSQRMLALLSGRSHQVFTSIACMNGERVESECVISEVSFADISLETMQRYWQSGEPVDKAGSYAIQGFGAVFVRKMSGSYTGIVGLPLYETAGMLARFSVGCFAEAL